MAAAGQYQRTLQEVRDISTRERDARDRVRVLRHTESLERIEAQRDADAQKRLIRAVRRSGEGVASYVQDPRNSRNLIIRDEPVTDARRFGPVLKSAEANRKAYDDRGDERYRDVLLRFDAQPKDVLYILEEFNSFIQDAAISAIGARKGITLALRILLLDGVSKQGLDGDDEWDGGSSAGTRQNQGRLVSERSPMHALALPYGLYGEYISEEDRAAEEEDPLAFAKSAPDVAETQPGELWTDEDGLFPQQEAWLEGHGVRTDTLGTVKRWWTLARDTYCRYIAYICDKRIRKAVRELFVLFEQNALTAQSKDSAATPRLRPFPREIRMVIMHALRPQEGRLLRDPAVLRAAV